MSTSVVMSLRAKQKERARQALKYIYEVKENKGYDNVIYININNRVKDVPGDVQAINFSISSLRRLGSWKAVDKAICTAIDDLNIDTLFITESLISKADLHKELDKFLLKFEENPDGNFSFNVNILSDRLIRFLIVLRLGQVAKNVIQYIEDPTECKLDKYFKSCELRYFYDYKGMVKDDFCYFISAFDNMPSPKEYIFTFGYTITNPTRASVMQGINLSRIPYSNIFVRDSLKKVNTTVPQSVYDDLIAKSKFTLIIPSYDVNTFSVLRFLEALNMDCIPIIHANCNYKEFLNQPEMLMVKRIYLKHNLITTDVKNTIKKSLKFYPDIIKELHNKLPNLTKKRKTKRKEPKEKEK